MTMSFVSVISSSQYLRMLNLITHVDRCRVCSIYKRLKTMFTVKSNVQKIDDRTQLRFQADCSIYNDSNIRV